ANHRKSARSASQSRRENAGGRPPAGSHIILNRSPLPRIVFFLFVFFLARRWVGGGSSRRSGPGRWRPRALRRFGTVAFHAAGFVAIGFRASGFGAIAFRPPCFAAARFSMDGFLARDGAGNFMMFLVAARKVAVFLCMANFLGAMFDNLVMSNGGHVLAPEALGMQMSAFHTITDMECAVVVEDARALAVEGPMMIVAAPEVVGAHENESVKTNSEADVGRDRGPMPPEAHAGMKFDTPRHWRPAHAPVALAPDDPRRGPIITGRPSPAIASIDVPDPAPVVKRNVAPRIIGLPEPPSVGVFPMAGIHIGTPVWIVGLHRNPGRAHVWNADPLAVRAQVRRKIIQRRNFRRRRGHGRRRRREGFDIDGIPIGKGRPHAAGSEHNIERSHSYRHRV